MNSAYHILKALLPITLAEKIFYSIDGAALCVWLFAGVNGWISNYIAAITAISITITLGVKIYNLFTHNKENKKV
jgi:hypothetical protein